MPRNSLPVHSQIEICQRFWPVHRTAIFGMTYNQSTCKSCQDHHAYAAGTVSRDLDSWRWQESHQSVLTEARPSPSERATFSSPGPRKRCCREWSILRTLVEFQPSADRIVYPSRISTAYVNTHLEDIVRHVLLEQQKCVTLVHEGGQNLLHQDSVECSLCFFLSEAVRKTQIIYWSACWSVRNTCGRSSYIESFAYFALIHVELAISLKDVFWTFHHTVYNVQQSILIDRIETASDINTGEIQRTASISIQQEWKYNDQPFCTRIDW